MKSVMGSESVWGISKKNGLPPRTVSGASNISSDSVLSAVSSDEMSLNGAVSSFAFSRSHSLTAPFSSSSSVAAVAEATGRSSDHGKAVRSGAGAEKASGDPPQREKEKVSRTSRIAKEGKTLPAEERQNSVGEFSLTPKEIVDLNWGLGVCLDPACRKRYEMIRKEKILAQRRSFENENWEARCFPR